MIRKEIVRRRTMAINNEKKKEKFDYKKFNWNSRKQKLIKEIKLELDEKK